MVRTNRTNRTMRAVRNAVLIAGLVGCLLALAVLGQAPPRESQKAIVILSPSYFYCQPCAQAKAFAERLKHANPKLRILEVKTSRTAAHELGIKAFPTIVIGEVHEKFDGDVANRMEAIQ